MAAESRRKSDLDRASRAISSSSLSVPAPSFRTCTALNEGGRRESEDEEEQEGKEKKLLYNTGRMGITDIYIYIYIYVHTSRHK